MPKISNNFYLLFYLQNMKMAIHICGQYPGIIFEDFNTF